MPISPDIAPSASALNLRRLVFIRAFVMAGQLAGIAYAARVLHADLPWVPLLATVAALGVINLLTWWRLRHPRSVQPAEIFLQLLVDICGLAIQLSMSGGATNPFVSYFLVPVCIAAALLPARLTTMITVLALAAYTLLLFVYQPLESLQPDAGVAAASAADHHGHHGAAGAIAAEPAAAASPEDLLNPHIVGMWVNFAISAVLIAVFVSRMARSLREQQALLNERRESELREKQIVAIASLAAGTAHELGTPLNTIALLADDLCEEPQHAQASADARLLRDQVALCRQILGKLRRAAELYRDAAPHARPLAELVMHCLRDWQLLRPSVRYRFEEARVSHASCLADSTLEQAILNLLNNAADAHQSAATDACVDITIVEEGDVLELRVADRGEGEPARLQMCSETPFLASGASGGLGLGLFLSRSSIERLGGQLHFESNPVGGVVAVLHMPRVALPDEHETQQ